MSIQKITDFVDYIFILPRMPMMDIGSAHWSNANIFFVLNLLEMEILHKVMSELKSGIILKQNQTKQLKFDYNYTIYCKTQNKCQL